MTVGLVAGWGGKASAAMAVPRQDGERAILAIDVVKDYFTLEGLSVRVLDGISFRVDPGERLAVLGRNGAGKSTLIKVMSGLERPTSGHIHRGLRMSWPLALGGGGFEGEMTGYDNMRFFSRIYNSPFREMYEFVTDFTELGDSIYEPVRYYSDGMRMRLALGVSLAIDFECLLIDEVILVGDRRFQDKCHYEIFERRKHCAMILAIHDMAIVEQFCDHAMVLKGGRGRVFDDVKLATAIYASL
jgi:capsular polysaccharide transport system ATP-binding protein